jgi:hypothetical protein
MAASVKFFSPITRPGEITRDAGVATSLALQFGMPLETLRRAVLRDPDGTASSPLGAALDLVAGEAS